MTSLTILCNTCVQPLCSHSWSWKRLEAFLPFLAAVEEACAHARTNSKVFGQAESILGSKNKNRRQKPSINYPRWKRPLRVSRVYIKLFRSTSECKTVLSYRPLSSLPETLRPPINCGLRARRNSYSLMSPFPSHSSRHHQSSNQTINAPTLNEPSQKQSVSDQMVFC